MIQKVLSRLACATALASCSFAGSAFAADAVPAAAPSGEAVEDDGFGSILVTAQFRQERLQDTPIAITALSGEMIEARGQNNVTDLAATLPNVALAPAPASQGDSGTYAFIRGIGQMDGNFAFEPGVGIYLDDVYYGVVFGSVFELTDLERVEVLRGPQGTLAGKNSLGGSIKLYSKKPEGRGGFVQAEVGNYNLRSIRASGDFAIAPDKLFLRISGTAKHRDGFMKRLDYGCASNSPSAPGKLSNDCVIGREGGQDIATLRGSLRWLVSDTVENNLIVDAMSDRSEAGPTKLIAQSGVWAEGVNYLTGPKSYTNYGTGIGYPGTPNAFQIPLVNNTDAWGISNTLDIDIGDNTSLKSITAFRHSNGDYGSDVDATPVYLTNIYYVVSHRQFSHELRLSGSLMGGMLDYTIGGYYYNARQTLENRVSLNRDGAPGGGLCFDPNDLSTCGNFIDFLSDDVIKADSASAFAHVQWRPVTDLTVTGGLRYTRETKSYSFRRSIDGLPPTIAGGSVLALDGQTPPKYVGSQVDYRIGVDYRWTPEIMTYAQISTGFKGGGINPRPFSIEQMLPFDPESITAYEIGFKSDFGRILRLNGSLFYNKYNDIQIISELCPVEPVEPCSLPMNAGSANVKGAELEAELRLGNLSAQGSVSVLDFEFTRLNANILSVTLDMITPYTPKVKYAIGAQYDIETSVGTLTPRLDLSYQGSFYSQPINRETNKVPAFALLNGRLGWKSADGSWEAALLGSNLLNKFYYAALNDYSFNNAIIGSPGRPREWSFSVKHNF